MSNTSINSTSQLVDNSMNFDPTMDSMPLATQSHAMKKMTPESAMILKITHPPTVCEEFMGLPTMDTRTQVILNWRNIDILKEPLVFDRSAGVAMPKSWMRSDDYSIVVPTGARIKWFGVTYSENNGVSNGAYEQDLNNVGIQDNFDFSIWSHTVNNYRPIAKSVTLYPNVTAFNNQGTIAVQQFNPAILFGGSVSDLSFTHVKLFHQMLDHYYSTKPEIFLKDVNSVSSSINTTSLDAWFRSRSIRPSGLSLDPDQFIQIINLGNVGYPTDAISLVPTPSQIVTNSMRSYADKFINGAFAVNRINTLSPEWMAGSNTRPGNGLYDCWSYTYSADGSSHLIPLLDPTPVGTSTFTTMRDTLWTKDMTWTFIRMQGISPNYGVTNESPQAAPICLKTYYTFEAQPVWNGPWNGLSRVSPMPSLKAMENLMDTFYNMPDAMPAKMNFLGSFLPTLIGMLPAGLKVIKSLFSSSSEEKGASSEPSKSSAHLESELTSLLSTVAQRVGSSVANKINRSKYAAAVPQAQKRIAPAVKARSKK